MGETPNTPPATPPATPPGDPGKGTDPKNTGNPEPFDPTKLGDEDLAKALEDPRLWNTPRLKELREAQKELKTIKAQQEEAEKKRLAEQGQFKELSEKNAKERDDATKRAADLELKMQILTHASKKGITDLDAAAKLIDQTNIKRNDDGTYTGLAEAVEALVKERPYLVNTNTSVGNPTNPANPGTPPGSYTMTQIGDPAFYQKNRDDILKAQREGRIVDDRLQPTK